MPKISGVGIPLKAGHFYDFGARDEGHLALRRARKGWISLLWVFCKIPRDFSDLLQSLPIYLSLVLNLGISQSYNNNNNDHTSYMVVTLNKFSNMPRKVPRFRQKKNGGGRSPLGAIYKMGLMIVAVYVMCVASIETVSTEAERRGIDTTTGQTVNRPYGWST